MAMPAFHTGGEKELLKAFLESVRKEFKAELADTTDYWQRIAIEQKIRAEARKRMHETSSSRSLWSS